MAKNRYAGELKEKRRSLVAEMGRIIGDGNRTLSRQDRERFDDLKADIESIDTRLAGLKYEKGDTRGMIPGKAGRKRAPAGTEGELLSPKQSVRDWHRANEDRHNEKRYGSDFDMDALFRQMSHMEPAGAEMRALEYKRPERGVNWTTRATGLGEDITSGSGAAAAIVPQDWSSQVWDIVRERLLLSKAGISTLVLPHEQYHYPLWNTDAQPVFLTEQTAMTPDTNPQFTDLLFNANGAYGDIALVSVQTWNDQGVDLSNFLKHMLAERYARLIEKVALYGQASSGTPGLYNETGLLTSGTAAPAGMGTNGAAPVDFSQISLGVEAVRKTNIEPNAILVNTPTGLRDLHDWQACRW